MNFLSILIKIVEHNAKISFNLKVKDGVIIEYYQQ